jgi:hypothetical protein
MGWNLFTLSEEQAKTLATKAPGSISLRKPYNTIDGRFRYLNREVIREVWNSKLSAIKSGESVDGKKANSIAMGNFRIAYNAGDPLSRVNFACGGPNPLNTHPGALILTTRDGMKRNKSCGQYESASTNVKYVYDSSLFTRFSREKAIQKDFSADYSYGGSNNGAYTAIRRSHM